MMSEEHIFMPRHPGIFISRYRLRTRRPARICWENLNLAYMGPETQQRIGKTPSVFSSSVFVLVDGVALPPAVFYHAERHIMTLVHGDAYLSSGSKSDLGWLESKLAAAYEIKTQRIGAGDGCEREGKVLNRIVRYTEEGYELEADPRHAELIIEQLGVGGKRPVITPGIDDDDVEDVEVEIAFDKIFLSFVNLGHSSNTINMSELIAF